ncbi:MAG TPA: response regulator, partial [Pyrinomonadaceae bacterium]|nr:response regulator [Pyrinomonadaceae bacterium]
LAISKRLCELMGGRMWASSAPGEGSTFRFTLQAAEAKLPEPSPRPDEVAGRRALVVAGHPSLRAALAEQAGALGLLVGTARDAGEALKLFEEEGPWDFAILDEDTTDFRLLTRRDGREAPSPPPPLVLVSAPSGGAFRQNGTAVPHARVHKPVRLRHLHAALAVALAGGRGDGPAAGAPREIDHGMAERVPLRILLAEDHAVNQKVVLNVLSRMGYRADVAADGAEALEAVSRTSYDILLMDVQMPVMDGLEATRRIRRKFPGASAPRILAMTAAAMRGDRERCLAAGMDDYLTKPIRPAALQAALLRWGGARADCPTPGASGDDAPAGANVSGPTDLLSLDVESLVALRRGRAEGEPDIVAELASLFLRDTPFRLDDILRALSAGEIEELERLTHTVKGSSLNLGAWRMASLCTRLEAQGRGRLFEEAGQTAAELRREFTQVSALLAAL